MESTLNRARPSAIADGGATARGAIDTAGRTTEAIPDSPGNAVGGTGRDSLHSTAQPSTSGPARARSEGALASDGDARELLTPGQGRRFQSRLTRSSPARMTAADGASTRPTAPRRTATQRSTATAAEKRTDRARVLEYAQNFLRSSAQSPSSRTDSATAGVLSAPGPVPGACSNK